MSALVRSALTLVALVAAVFGLAPVVADGPWQVEVVVAVTGLWALVSAVRVGLRPWLERRPLLVLGLPSLVGLVAGTVTVLVRFGGDGAPGPRAADPWWQEALHQVTDRFAQVGALLQDLPGAIAHGSTPIEPDRPIELAVLGGAMLLLLVVELLVAGLGMTWGALVGVLAAWAAPVVLVHDVPTVPFLVAVACCVLVPLVPSDRAPWRAWAVRVGAGTVVAALLAGVGLAGANALTGDTTPRALTWVHVSGTGTGPFDVDTSIQVGTDLGQQSSAVAYRYHDEQIGVLAGHEPTTGAGAEANPDTHLGPMRLYTLLDFDGQEWSPRPASDAYREPATHYLVDQLDSQQVTPPHVRRTVVLEQLASPNLPGSLEPARITPSGGLQFDPRASEIVAPGQAPTSYSLAISPRHLTAGTLRDQDLTGMLGGPGGRYEGIPSTTHADDIAALARTVTAGATTEYDRLVALQDYFRTTGGFTYSTDVAPTQDDDPVWTFLQTKHGYCVQFATAMLVMARSLNIPARLGVGFLPGRVDDAGDVEVTGAQAHTWPEFAFADVGWVRFEPTPGVQTGEAPAWTVKKATDPDQPDPTPSSTPTPTTPTPSQTTTPATPTTTPSTSPSASPAEPTARSGASPVVWGVTGAAVVLVLLLVGATTLVRRRRRTVRDLTVAWRRVTRAARRAGLPQHERLTVRQTGDRITALLAARAVEAPDAASARSALDGLVTAMEERQYAERPEPPTVDALTAWTTTLVAALRHPAQPGATPPAPSSPDQPSSDQPPPDGSPSTSSSGGSA